MTGIDPKRLERRLRWAAEQLGLSPDASLDEVRAAWLRRLPAEEFVPSSELRWALAALLRRPSEGGWEARADEVASAAEEERLRGEVEAFAAKFWDFPVEERRRRWVELSERCAFAPALRARLRLLEPGLDCVPVLSEAKEDTRVIELANYVRELFVLRPGPRARARQEILIRTDSNRKEWKAAVRRLRRSSTAYRLAALGNDLLDAIVAAKPKIKRLSTKPQPQPVAANGTGQKSRWPMWIVVGIAVSIVRIFITVSNHPSPAPSPPVQLSPDENRRTWEELNRRLQEELRRRKENPPKGKSDKTDKKNP